MKQKDIAALFGVIGFSAILSYVICSKIITPPSNRKQKVEVVEKIVADFNVKDLQKYFSDNSVNPTKLIEIAPNSNNQPFIKS